MQNSPGSSGCGWGCPWGSNWPKVNNQSCQWINSGNQNSFNDRRDCCPRNKKYYRDNDCFDRCCKNYCHTGCCSVDYCNTVPRHDCDGYPYNDRGDDEPYNDYDYPYDDGCSNNGCYINDCFDGYIEGYICDDY